MAFLRKNLSTLVFVLALLLVRTTFANQYMVPTGSMIPTISIGDRIYTNRVAYDLKLPFTDIILKRLDDPKRGDVVVFDSPQEKGLVLVKRLIALPGDHVHIENGHVELNGQRLDTSPAQSTSYYETLGSHHYTIQRLPERMRDETYDFTVPADHYFMMGDNRDNSADGRVFGSVDRSLLIGRADRVLFSMDFPNVDLTRTGKRLD